MKLHGDCAVKVVTVRNLYSTKCTAVKCLSIYT
jgi:hypothetical protein